MKRFKKLLITSLAAIGTVCLAAGLAACGGGDNGNNNPDGEGQNEGKKVPLIAPVIDLSGDVLSWGEIAHADGYIVYEDGKSVSEQTETSYTITQDYPGTYTYTVKATTTQKGYSESPLSNEKKFKVNPYTLASPVISIDENGIISWNEVDHADTYEIYENGTAIANTSALSYTIEQTTPAEFKYTVVAKSADKAYSKSQPSNEATYKVPLHLSIGVEFPEEFEGTVTVGIYDGAKLVASAQVTRDEVEGGYSDYGSASFIVKEWGSYVAKVTELSEGYVATWARVSTDRRNGSIKITEKTADNVLSLNKNTLTVTVPAGENSVTAQYIFIAGHSDDGAHSIIIDEGLTGLQISAAERTVISTTQNAYKGSFSTVEGEVIIISVTYTKPSAPAQQDAEQEPADEQFSFEIEIVDYEVRVPVRILPEPYDIEHRNPENENYLDYEPYTNVIYDSCVRYIEVEESGEYEFFFPSNHAHNTFITLTVNGQSYDLSGGGSAKVNLEAGKEIRIEIELSYSSEIHFYVYVAPVEEEE